MMGLAALVAYRARVNGAGDPGWWVYQWLSCCAREAGCK